MSSQIPDVPPQPVLPESWEQLAAVAPSSSLPPPSSSTPSPSEVPPPSSDAPAPPPSIETPAVAPKKKMMRLNPNASSFVPAPAPAPAPIVPANPLPQILQPNPTNFPPYQQPFDMFGGEYGGYYNAYPGFPNLPPNMGFPPIYNQPEMLFDEQSGFA